MCLHIYGRAEQANSSLSNKHFYISSEIHFSIWMFNANILTSFYWSFNSVAYSSVCDVVLDSETQLLFVCINRTK